MTVRVKSIGGSFVTNNQTPIVDLLSAPSEGRGHELLGVNFTGMDAQNNNDRCVLALNMGRIEPASLNETGAHRTILLADPLSESDNLHVIATAAVTGGVTSGGPGLQTQYVPLHGLLVVEQLDVLVYLPDNTTDLVWFCELFYEDVRMSMSAWSTLRHRPSVEHRTIGSVTV